MVLSLILRPRIDGKIDMCESKPHSAAEATRKGLYITPATANPSYSSAASSAI